MKPWEEFIGSRVQVRFKVVDINEKAKVLRLDDVFPRFSRLVEHYSSEFKNPIRGETKKKRQKIMVYKRL